MSQQHPVNAILEDWNRLEQQYAMETIRPCNGSTAWAIGMVNAGPFETLEDLYASSDRVWLGLTPTEWQQAFDSHPRIGEHKAKAATEQSLQWSAGEQSAAAMDASIEEKLAAANKEYEQKFGRIFIVCASGKTAAEMLAILNARLENDAAVELKEAVEQQRQITQLRLRKWLKIG
jgi:2-oxo-4-hydroxy-4-carboxy-5-ureidoimidazoline decarboxylase